MLKKLQITRRDVMVMIGCIALSMFIAWLDDVTGEDYDFFVFYFAPIAIAAWWIGWPAGILVALLAAGSWFEIDWLTDTHPSYMWSVGLWDTTIRLVAFLVLALTVSRIRAALAEKQRLNDELTQAMAQIKQLSGILPICSICKKIRNDREEWVPLERYISLHSEAQLSHGLCPHCFRKFYGENEGT